AGRFAAPVPLLDTMAVAAPLLRDVGHTAPLAAIAKGEARVAVGLSGTYLLGAAEADLLLLVRDGALHGVRHADTTLEAEPSIDGARHLARVRWTPKPETLLASEGAAVQPLADAFDRGALGASAELLGLAQRMIEIAVEYAKVRKQFGAPIGSFQAVKHHLASALLKVEFARPAVYRAAYSMAQNDPERSVHVSMGKACAGDAATHAARAALQCHGAIGYSFEHDLHLWMKRAWALAAAWGHADWHRARVATAILGQEES
ncbi:MAG TPA: acyl-CoA dehydrogenase family protein, partial [Polyangiaceae bacterium]